MLPEHLEIPYFDAEALLPGLAAQPGLVFLDSSNQHLTHTKSNRYSYLCYQPIDYLYLKNAILDESPLKSLQNKLNQFSQVHHPDLPPFQGGAMGCFSYDLCHYFEEIPQSKPDDMNFPDMAVGIYDAVISFDHHEKKSWIVSTGYPHCDEGQRLKTAKKRLQQVHSEINAAKSVVKNTSFSAPRMQSNFSKKAYQQMVQRAMDYILDGDVFEVNLSQRFQTELDSPEDALNLYLELRNINPAPFSGYLRFDDFVLASASPERFLQVADKQVESRPIKGTTARYDDPIDDEKSKKNLLNSEKDRAENTMIVDLMRNDLSRVCKHDSIAVTQLCKLETFASVHHLVSAVKGTLKESQDAIDLLEASFPGGSITGAPKIRSMQIISELETCPRGPHFGSLGYIGFNGNMDTSILIRSFAIMGKKVTLQAGGAVILDSDPGLEYEESLLKAANCQKALECL